jgi:hypothetical protein
MASVSDACVDPRSGEHVTPIWSRNFRIPTHFVNPLVTDLCLAFIKNREPCVSLVHDAGWCYGV